MGRESPMPESNDPKLTAYVFLSVLKIWIYFFLLPISRSWTVTVRQWPAYSQSVYRAALLPNFLSLFPSEIRFMESFNFLDVPVSIIFNFGSKGVFLPVGIKR